MKFKTLYDILFWESPAFTGRSIFPLDQDLLLVKTGTTGGGEFRLKQFPQFIDVSLHTIMRQDKCPLRGDKQIGGVLVTVYMVNLLPLVICVFLAVVHTDAVKFVGQVQRIDQMRCLQF